MNMRYAMRSEDTEQINVVSWANWNMNRYPELKWLHHVPNGGSRNKQEAVKLKQMGVKAGVSDLCLPYPKCLLFIYVGLAMVTGGVLPHDEVAGAPTILPAAQAILPGAVYKIFMIGGPIMAIITTLNGVFNDVRYPLAQAAKDGWLPKFILKENRFGAPYLIYTYTLIVVLIPIVTDMSIVTITNIFQVITFFMNVTVVYAISRLPKRYPEAWAKNKFHFSNGALYTFCTVSIIIYTVIFVKGIFSIKVSYAVAAVIVMLALILIGIYLTKKGGIRIETSLWDPSVKKEEK